jgi:signal transduction histidine kinase
MFKEIIFKRPTITKRLLSWFLLVTLPPLTFFGYICYHNSRNAIKKEVTNNLITIADSKARQIEHYILKKEKYVAVLANTPTIIKAMEKFNVVFKKDGIDSPEYRALDKEFRPSLTYYQESFGYYDLFLISCEGEIIFTVIKEDDFGTNLRTGPYNNSELAKVFNKAYTLLKTEMSDFKYYAPSNAPATFIAAPIVKEVNAIGIVVFQINNEEAYELMQDYTGLGKTGETLIGAKIGNEAVFVNPLRHDPNAAFIRKVNIGSQQALPIQEAVQKRKGLGLSIDYRGEEILAVWRYLPSPRWGMVVKIDTKESFAPVHKLRSWLLIIGIIIVCAVIVTAWFISKSISKPIQALQKGAETIGSGNLDYKVGTKINDEIGQLSRAFDRMTESLKTITVSRDELVKEINDRKQAEEKLKNILIAIERSNKELQQFVYVASHDLQEPLRMVASYTQLLKDRYKDKLDNDAKDFIQFAVDGATRMQRLIKDLLTYARIGAKNKPFGPINCNSLLEQTVADLRFVIGENNAIITNDNLPTVTWDIGQMRQLFQNLITNAIKFQSQESPRIHVSAKKRGNEWIFSVQDNGIGIDPQYKDRIFMIFQRLHSREDYPGTGIGRAICKRIIERNGGRIWVDSEISKGSTFYFTIPIKGVNKL